MNGVLVGMEYAKAINTTQIESAVGRTEYGIFYVFAVQSTVQLIEPGETDVLILRIYVDACDTVTGRYPDVSIFVLNNALDKVIAQSVFTIEDTWAESFSLVKSSSPSGVLPMSIRVCRYIMYCILYF